MDFVALKRQESTRSETNKGERLPQATPLFFFLAVGLSLVVQTARSFGFQTYVAHAPIR